MLLDFDSISDDSRLWVYGSETKLTTEQQEYILQKIGEYLKNWEYHKKPLTAAVTILEGYFIIVALDSSEYGVGGCSIDSLQRILQDIECKLNISLLNRLNIFYRIDNNIECIPTTKLAENTNKDTFFYDLTIQKKSELSSWLKPIEKGWCISFLS